MPPTAQTLLNTKTGALIWFCLAAGIVAFVVPQWLGWPANAWKTMVLYSVAGSFVASSIFTTIYVVFSNDQLLAVIRDGARSAVLESLDPSQRFVPLAEYPASKSAGVSFNAALSQSIRSSRRFIFQGATAQHAAARLEAVESYLGSVRVMIHDPSDGELLRWRANHSFAVASKVRRGVGPTDIEDGLESAINELRQHIVTGLCGLYDYVRHRADLIEIIVVTKPYLDRFEMTDDAVFFQPFHRQERGRIEHPPAYMFSKSSLFYDHLLREFDVVASHWSSRTERILSITTKEEFDSMMQRLFLDSWHQSAAILARERFDSLLKQYKGEV